MDRIMFITYSMGFGGAERVISLLSNQMIQSGIKVEILVQKNLAHSYSISKEISVIAIEKDIGKHRNSLLNRVIRIRSEIKKFRPDCIVSFVSDLNSLLSVLGTKNKLIISERFDPAKTHSSYIRMIRNVLYPLASGYVFQTEGAKQYFDRILKKKEKKIIINNPLNKDLPYHFAGPDDRSLIAANRLENKQKNITLMIDAVEKLNMEGEMCRLRIFGEGPDKDMLQNYINDKKMDQFIELKGFSTNIHEEIAQSTAFLISSNYEGVSNSMLEALAIGTPVISTDSSPGGARTFITNGINGFLVPVGDVERFAAAIKWVLNNPGKAKEIGSKATRIRDELDSEKIAKKWLEFIEEVIGDR